MNCPHCGFKWNVLALNGSLEAVPDPFPILCEKCGEFGIFDGVTLRKIEAEELEAVKTSPAWPTYQKVLDLIHQEMPKQ